MEKVSELSIPSARHQLWSKLSPGEQTQATILGHTENTWNSFTGISVEEVRGYAVSIEQHQVFRALDMFNDHWDC